jgi:hypothetical protein
MRPRRQTGGTIKKWGKMTAESLTALSDRRMPYAAPAITLSAGGQKSCAAV